MFLHEEFFLLALQWLHENFFPPLNWLAKKCKQLNKGKSETFFAG